MTQHFQRHQAGKQTRLFDYVFYILAGSVMAAFSFSFLLWLGF